MGDRSLIDMDEDIWFGFDGCDLSYQMKIKAARFDNELTEWMLDNVGEYGKEWWAEIDREKDSMRAVFRDPAMETWVAMKWCDNDEA